MAWALGRAVHAVQAAPGGPELVSPGAVGLGEGARGCWDVGVGQESRQEFVYLSVCLHQQAACASQPRLAAPWLRPGGTGLQQRAAALPKARHGNGTDRACHALHEEPSRSRAEELLLL